MGAGGWRFRRASRRQFARSADPALLWNLVLGSSSAVDRRVSTDSAFAAAYKRALTDGFTQGAAGDARDLVLATSRWPFDPAAIRVPAHLWNGGLDASPVHSPDQGAGLARRVARARRHLLLAAGGSVPWTHVDARGRTWTHAGEIIAAPLAAVRR